MKTNFVFALALCIVLVSCSSNDELPVRPLETKNAFGLTPTQMSGLGLAKIVTYTRSDEQFVPVVREMLLRFRPELKGNTRSMEVALEQVGNFYMATENFTGDHVMYLQTGSANDEFYTEVKPIGLPYPKLMRLKMNFVKNKPAGVKPFNPVAYDWGTGKPITGINGYGSLGDRETWWNCVQAQFKAMCASSIYNAIMCGAAGAVVPELMLAVYASWMISCAW